MYTQPFYNSGIFESKLSGDFQLSGGAGYPSNSFNKSLDFGEQILSLPNWCEWDAVAKKINIKQTSKYRVIHTARAFFSFTNLSLMGSAEWGLRSLVNSTSKASLRLTYGANDPVKSNAFFSKYWSNETTGNDASSGWSIGRNGSGIVDNVAFNGALVFTYDSIINQGDSVSLNLYNTISSYSSPARTAPEGSSRFANLSTMITLLT